MRQPRLVGEVIAGLVLGPTVLGALSPELHDALFPPAGHAADVLSGISRLGLLMLMLVAGTEMRAGFERRRAEMVGVISVSGLALPFAAGLLMTAVIDTTELVGPAGDRSAIVVLLAIATAVASIPVISRIMLDLGILDTVFARVVLAIAVIDDLVLYAVLAIVLGLTASDAGAPSLLDHLGLASSPGVEAIVAGLMTIGLLAAGLRGGPILYRTLRALRPDIGTADSVTLPLLVMFIVTSGAVLLGVGDFFGAFVAGVVLGADSGGVSVRSVRYFASAFFIPLYFAVVGLRIDLGELDPPFFVGFLVASSAVKSASVYAGARLVRMRHDQAAALAVALNARGGPGIVLATVALDAFLISRGMYATLVLVALITSLLAAGWLARVVARDRALLDLDVHS